MEGKISLTEVRQKMASKKLDIYIQPRSDMYGGEEVPAYDERLKFLSGFTGSAGISIITLKNAILFVDGRYLLQAKMQVTNDWTIMPLFKESWIDWIVKNSSTGEKIGYDPWLIRVNDINSLNRKLDKTGIKLQPGKKNFIDSIWKDRPKIYQNDPRVWDKKYFPIEKSKKINQLIKEMRSKSLDALIITQPNQLCWLLNIRGDDLKYSPLFLGFLVIEKNGKINIFSRNKNKNLQNLYANNSFSNLIPYIEKFKNQKVAININYCPSIIFEKLKESNVEIDQNFIFLQEASTIKNKNEIIFIRKCHIRDGAALIKFLHWIEKEIPSNKISEYQASCKLKEYRSYDKNFISESFPSIVATGGNGAIIHYRPMKDKSKIISKEKLFLIDSGGQYFDGTTDITRTISFKNQPQDIINKYTYVLKAHIAMAKLKFKTTTRGNEIDSIVRSKLWEAGLDYDHGTGHGVGYCLGVHEFPPVISKNTSLPLKAGQLLSNEPGYYVKDKFGIRLENLVIVQNCVSNDKEFFEFETVSLCHFERNLINKNLLDKDEIMWINKYHKFVYLNLKVLLNTKEKQWLKRKTEKI